MAKRQYGRNPNNPGSDLFKSLTRIFSGPIVNRRTQTGRRLRRGQLDKFSSRIKSASGQQFKRSNHLPFNNMHPQMMNNHNRAERYVDFDQMEYTPEIASAMDIYADEMTAHSGLEDMLSIKCSNEEIKSVLDTLYHDVMNIEHNLFGWARSMCKYGDFFLYLDIDDKYGIRSCIGLPSTEVERLEGEDKTNPDYVQFQWNTAGLTLENWQMGHFRILGNDKYAPYGTSVLEPARRIWRQLVLLEDAMMAYRIVRAPDRRMFKIDVGNIPANEVEQYMQKVMTQMKRNQVVDSDTGRVDLRYNPLSIEEDYFIPVRGGSQTDIIPLSGGTNAGDIDDVRYLRDKLFSALKVPASYLTNSEGGEEDKTTLAQKDIRFARTIQRLQRSVVSELEKIGVIHLYTLGFRGDDLVSFDLSLANPSKLAELQELEHWKAKFDVASAASTDGYFSRRWVAKHLFNVSEDEFLRNQRELFYDRKFDATLEATAAAVAEAAAGAGGDMGADMGGGGGGMEDLGAMMAGGAPEEGGEEAPAEEGAEGAPEEGGEEDVLLSSPDEGPPPGRREDEPTQKSLEIQSKGKPYFPVTYDKRADAGRAKNYKRSVTPETSKRTMYPGWSGVTGLRSVAKGLFEEQESIYEGKVLLEERKLFETSHEVRRLVESLEGLEKKKDEA